MINLQLGKTAEGTLELSTKVLQRHFGWSPVLAMLRLGIGIFI